jgi:hypothetical protein
LGIVSISEYHISMLWVAAVQIQASDKSDDCGQTSWLN